MPGRTIPLITDQIYHVYNRGSEKKPIFSQTRDFRRFLKTLNYYQFVGPKPSFSKFNSTKLNTFKTSDDKKLVDILGYCLMPNHFHFILRQRKENGISIFISQLINSYTKYFNTKYTRVGALLQGVFKSVWVESDEQLIHLSRYIHLNPVVSNLSKHLDSYPWSSYQEYLLDSTLCETKTILDLFPSEQAYQKFVEDQIEYGTSLEILKHAAIDFDD